MAPAGVALGVVIGLHQQAEVLADRLPPLLVAAERWRRRSPRACTAGAGSASAIPSGSSGRISLAIPPPDRLAAVGALNPAVPARPGMGSGETVWLWADASGSMAYGSAPRVPTKQDRALLLLLALASLLTRAGERIALLGDQRRPTGGRAAVATSASGWGPTRRSLPASSRSSGCRGMRAWC